MSSSPAATWRVGGPDSDGPAAAAGGSALLCVANWSSNKGVLELLEALAGLPDGHATLHLAGREDVDGAYATTVRARMAQSDLGDRVVAHGPLDRRAVADLYANADGFVLPSYVETYGTVYGEALAAGLPTVGWRAGNLPNLVTDGREGCLVTPGDVDGLRGGARSARRRRRVAGAARRGGPPARGVPADVGRRRPTPSSGRSGRWCAGRG